MKKKFWMAGVLILVVLVAGMSIVGAAAPVKLTVWSLQRPNETDSLGWCMMNQIKAFEKANPGIDIEYNYTENEAYKTKLQVAMLGGAGPDILFNWGGETQAIYSREGLLYDLTKAVGKDYWGLSKGLFSNHVYNGRIYGIPFFPTVNTVWYNKKMFAKYGITPPKTWSQLLTVCEKLKSQGIIPFTVGGKDSWTILHAFMYMADRVAGAKMYQAAKAGKARFDNPAFVKAFGLLDTLVKKGYFPPDALNLTYGDACQLMMKDKAAMMAMGNWHFTVLTNENKSDFDKWDFFTYPVVEGGKSDPHSILGAADGFSINQSCKNPAAAVKFLKFMASKENMAERFQKSSSLASLATPYMEDNTLPQMKGLANVLAHASSLTLWWDQDLPAPMSQALLQGLQEIMGGAKTPKQVATAFEEARKLK
ncbi:carbohydrate ABC transporter substrate-binding protein (CUT1 family) [Hydrogenispora ethanolica]|uniref:Carbohydrate ABC transporter substrate-binding protein (CUT1 family) n=1 Tax=Hydrogenispora ethanolica TaxID=1082276 RepID=A0A4R1SE99_HYDET|nr:extracellular solute-binding protein [Hydrogenispora ethanolica]TCL77002.1 carbohydrate ABC transporter substrate-binding protein (CUT1 family) [Hydrogenispora ethanolica]